MNFSNRYSPISIKPIHMKDVEKLYAQVNKAHEKCHFTSNS